MQAVTTERLSRHIVLVTIQRPEARNSVDPAVASGLDAAVKAVEADPEIWAAILTGAGGTAFCAGADLKAVSQGRLPELSTPDGGFAGFVLHPREKLWIAAVEGFAVAGGFELALACDLIVASENSAFALPEVMRGLVAAAGGVYRLPRALPRALALELIATGDRLSPQRAAEFGLVNRVAVKGGAVAEALLLAERVCANAPIAVRESLKVARRAYDFDDPTLFALGLAAQDVVMKTEDFIEGPRAFIEKRPANWKGR
jgi:enoyl-CoA hydratase/carnithine racemase